MTKSITIDYWHCGEHCPRTVIADVEGALAIHEAPDLSGKYTLTHVPTGAAVKSWLSRSQAKRLRALLADCDWRFKSHKSPKVARLQPVVRSAVCRVLNPRSCRCGMCEPTARKGKAA